MMGYMAFMSWCGLMITLTFGTNDVFTLLITLMYGQMSVLFGMLSNIEETPDGKEAGDKLK
jgi:hypothetical protein